jgi:hypothetical protein
MPGAVLPSLPKPARAAAPGGCGTGHRRRPCHVCRQCRTCHPHEHTFPPARSLAPSLALAAALLALALAVRPAGREPGICRRCGGFGSGKPEAPCPKCGSVYGE